MGILELSIKFAAENAKEEGKIEGKEETLNLVFKVMDLLNQGLSINKIAKEFDIDIALVKRIAATLK